MQVIEGSGSAFEVKAAEEKKSSSENKGSYKGVFRCGKKFKAQIQTNRVQHYLGLYDTELEAAKAYDNHARVVLGPRAKTNFDYSNSAPPGASNVVVAPIYTRAESKQSASTTLPISEGSGPPKRTYVGIKLKRQAPTVGNSSGMTNGPRNSGGSRIDDNKKAKLDHLSGASGYMGGMSGIGGLGNLGGLPGMSGILSTGPSSLNSYSMYPSLGMSSYGQDYSGMPGMGLGGPSYPSMMSTGMLSSGPPPSMTSPEEQLRWYEQFFQMQCGMSQPGASSLYFNQQPNYSQTSTLGNNSYNPYAATASSVPALYPSNFGSDSVAFSYPNSAHYDSFSLPSSTPQFSSVPSYFASGAGSGTSSGSVGSASTSQPGDLNTGLNSNIASSKQTTAELRTAALAAMMNPKPLSIDTYSSISSSRYNGPLSTTSGREQRQSTSNAESFDRAERGMGLLSAAVSSLPNSSSGSPDAATGHVSSDSDSDRDRTSHLLAAASTMLNSASPRSQPQFTHHQQSVLPLQVGGDEVKLNLVEPDTHAVPEQADSDEPDWRDQLYYWIGVLYYDPGRRQQVWKGSWVGSYTGKPSPEEFSASSNHFEYHMPSRSGHPLMRPDGGLAPQSGQWQGHYLMDNTGEGTWEKYMDTEYEVLFEPVMMPDGSEKFFVYGRGDSEFGAFVVTGRFCQHSRVLEMTRQYIADEDVRASLTLSQFAQYCKQQK